jgi:hypothetical protein
VDFATVASQNRFSKNSTNVSYNNVHNYGFSGEGKAHKNQTVVGLMYSISGFAA